MNRTILMLLSAVLLSGCSVFMDKEVQWESVPPEDFPVLKAVGYAPISAQQGDSDEQKMSMNI